MQSPPQVQRDNDFDFALDRLTPRRRNVLQDPAAASIVGLTPLKRAATESSIEALARRSNGNVYRSSSGSGSGISDAVGVDDATLTAEERKVRRAEARAALREAARIAKAADREARKDAKEQARLEDLRQKAATRVRVGVPADAHLVEEIQLSVDAVFASTAVGTELVQRLTAGGIAHIDTAARHPVPGTVSFARRDRIAAQGLSLRSAYYQPPNPHTAEIVLWVPESEIVAAPDAAALRLGRLRSAYSCGSGSDSGTGTGTGTGNPRRKFTVYIVRDTPQGRKLPENQQWILHQALLTLGLAPDCTVRRGYSTEDAALMLVSRTLALARAPYVGESSALDVRAAPQGQRAALAELKLTDSVGSRGRVPDYSDATVRKSVWFRVLHGIPSVSIDVARAIMDQYPTMGDLLAAYADIDREARDARVALEKKGALLAEIVRPSGSRKIGVSISQRIATLLLTRDPEDRI
jgi:hypothetical protein